uniref:CARD domain-containing protein n=1 Tax=Plectus sambesii TaxID=2011161 RepID=A0A914VBB1_9BILA
MDKLKQEAIKSHYAKLVECMDPLRVMDHLAKLLSLEDMELIRKSQFISQERTRELITIILRKNEELRPFELLIKALEETDINHETMANTILNTYVCLLFDRSKRWQIKNMTMVLLFLRKSQKLCFLILEK